MFLLIDMRIPNTIRTLAASLKVLPLPIRSTRGPITKQPIVRPLRKAYFRLEHNRFKYLFILRVETTLLLMLFIFNQKLI
jgi:hypothetical protein